MDMDEEFAILNAEHSLIKQEHEKLLTTLKRVMQFNGWTRTHGVELAQCEREALEVIEKIEGLTC